MKLGNVQTTTANEGLDCKLYEGRGLSLLCSPVFILSTEHSAYTCIRHSVGICYTHEVETDYTFCDSTLHAPSSTTLPLAPGLS